MSQQRRRIAWRVVVWACVLAMVGGAAPRLADAASGSGLRVTIAARTCDEYTDIFGNLARNNIMESLKDLGPDSPYASGEPVNPAKEDLSPQSRCKPLPNWVFTLGTGYRSLAVPGPWGNLSIVTGPYASPAIVTKASTPLLNTAGQATGQQIAGATTVELTDAQADRAARTNSLWLQGGTTTDPVLNQQYPGQYGFGALRCAIDNLNGDNVEWIAFPQGSRHVFCYAYYVKPPPTSGTIIVRKQIDAPAGTSQTSFTFDGNISFNADGSFALAAAPGSPGSETFYRAEVTGDTPEWSFAEHVPQGWTLTDIACASKTGKSTSTTSLAAARTSVRLAANDVVTCTYTDRLTPPPAGLLLSKVSIGGIGTFGWSVTPEAGGPIRRVSATTSRPGIVTPGTPALSVDPGVYRVQESLPRSTQGRWRLVQARCNGRIVAGIRPVTVTLSSGQGTFCTFFNSFRPNGTIRLRKRTVGAVGTVGFVIEPVATPATRYEQTATTTEEDQPVLATGDNTSAVRLGSYVIQETTPTDRVDGYWTSDSVTCNGTPVGGAQGRVTITLTTAVPDVVCTFSDRFTPGPVPPAPPAPTPPTPPTPEEEVEAAAGPSADLVLVKRASPTAPEAGAPVHYTVTLTNRGPDSAQNVTVTEVSPTLTSPLVVTASRGTCTRARPVVCRVGTVRRGEVVTFRATAAYIRPGARTNTAAAITSTSDPNLRNNVARATVRVRVAPLPPRPRFTG